MFPVSCSIHLSYLITRCFFTYCSVGVHRQVHSGTAYFKSYSPVHRSTASSRGRPCLSQLRLAGMGLHQWTTHADIVRLLQTWIRRVWRRRRVLHRRSIDFCLELVQQTPQETLLLCIHVHRVPGIRWRL